MQDIEEIYKEYAKTVYKYIFCLSRKQRSVRRNCPRNF